MGIILRTVKRIPVFYRRFGWKGISIVYRQKLQKKKIIRFKYLKEFLQPVYLRKGKSDFPVFESVLVNRCYDIDYNIDPQIIFDCGANIGLTSIFYANKFPKAKVISIEPETTNFELLKKNTEQYLNIHVYQYGLWNKAATLKMEDKGYGEWGFTAKEVPNGTPGGIQAVSIPDLMQQQQIDSIDILKIDIEGSEKELFESNCQTWLPKVKVIVIELHDRMREGTAASFFKALVNYNFTLEIKGENLICFMK